MVTTVDVGKQMALNAAAEAMYRGDPIPLWVDLPQGVYILSRKLLATVVTPLRPLEPLDLPSRELVEYGVGDRLETEFRALERRVRERNERGTG